MKIGKFRIIKEENYLGLKADSKNWKERSAIVKDNEINKMKEKLKKKYAKYFGRKYYDKDEGIIFEISTLLR